jgi:hypothetical protein
MNRVMIKSKTGADGVLHLDVPLGSAEADKEVQITIESLPVEMTHAEWFEFIERTAGTWQGPFERAEQLPYEKREEL